MVTSFPPRAGTPEQAPFSPRQARWRELDSLLKQAAQRGLASLGPDGLERLTLLYRTATADLAAAQSEGWPRAVVEYLNELVARAHALIYAVQPRSRLGLLTYFFGVVPLTFRRRWRYVAASAGLNIAIALIAFLAVRQDPALAHQWLGPFAEAVEDFARGHRAAGAYFADQPLVKYLGGGALSAFLFLHNLQVALAAFALGALPLVGTLGLFYLLLVNAMMVGVFLALGANEAALSKLAAVIAPHGALELPAIFLAQAGGLLMSHAFINPGPWRRVDAWRMAAQDALALLAGAVPLLLAAGLIEGNISPLFRWPFASEPVRLVFALVMFIVAALYLARGEVVLSQQRRERLPPPPPWP
jgi:uncharacterized membrane protein SpoIIM required for sporulation